MRGSDTANRSTVTAAETASWLEQRLIRFLDNKLQGTSGRLHLTLPSGNAYHFGQGDQVSVTLHSYRPLVRLYLGGINGWSEGYLAAEWDTPDLTALVHWALRNEDALSAIAKASFVKRTLHNLYHRRRSNSKRGSKRNIEAHYDLGNDFYKLWLDNSMTYSSALFHSPQESLEQAQGNKYQRILDLLEPKAGDKIAEIGCGWGGFMQHALEQADVEVEGITLSHEQKAWAEERLAKHQLAERGRVSLTDYRDLVVQYDGIVSIEMFEAVGEEYWDTYFEMLKRSLKPGGRAVLQIITIEDQRFETYRKQADFIQRYIFPGGMLPSVSKLLEKFAQHGLTLEHSQMFGPDYARTLRHWHHDFEQAWPQVAAQGFDERFRRMWRYYLSYCEGGFDEGTIDVGLFVLSHAESK